MKLSFQVLKSEKEKVIQKDLNALHHPTSFSSQVICVLSFVCNSAFCKEGRVRYSFEHCLHCLIYLIHFPILLG